MTSTDIHNYMSLLMRYKLNIPIEHECEPLINEYPVVPLLWFTVENGIWSKCTLICISEDEDENSQNIIKEQLIRVYRKDQHWEIRDVWSWTYNQLDVRLRFIKLDQTYNFRYIYHIVDGIIRDAILVVDEHPEQGHRFDVLHMIDHETWIISPVADNGKTLKRNLEELYNYLERIRRGIEQNPPIEIIIPKMKKPIDLGYDDDEVSEFNF